MGSKITAVAFYDNYERIKYGQARLFNCTSAFLAKKFNSDDEEYEPKDEKGCPEIDPTDINRAKVTRFGPAPENKKKIDLSKDWNKGDAKTGFEPVAIKFELTPIVNLFTPENLDFKHDISSSRILKWFLKDDQVH